MQYLLCWALIIAVFSFILYMLVYALGWRQALKVVVVSLTISAAIVAGFYLVNT